MLPFSVESSLGRVAQSRWAALRMRERLAPVWELRYLLVEQADELTAAVEADVQRDPGEVVATDVLPTAAACQFLLRRAESLLKPRRIGDRPFWLFGCRDTVHHRPHGLVGVIGTWNYPVFLNAVPIVQALVAGNGVLWKPSELTPRTAEVLHELFLKAGFPRELFLKLPATREAGPQLADADIDFLHFTGSDTVGRKLAARLGERLIPSVLELSGVDAVFVFADADATLAARLVWYGTTLNHGQTCMACRRVFVHQDILPRFLAELRPLVEATGPMVLVTPGQQRQAEELIREAEERGCEIIRGKQPGCTGCVPTVIVNATPEMRIAREAVFSPVVGVIPFSSTDQALSMDRQCNFGLAASVFTANRSTADELARELRVGSVIVNDVIVPTAHPATPFGGRRSSGWGVSQGAEGLLQMTVPQVVSHRRGRFRPHVDAGLTGDPAAAEVARGILRASHSRRWQDRFAGVRQMLRGMLRSSR